MTRRAIPLAAARQRRWFAPAIAVLLVLVVAAVWIGSHRLSSRATLERAAPSMAASQAPVASASAPPAAGASSDHPAQPLANGSLFVLHEEVPDVSRSALGTIHGHIKIAVRVTVDSSGQVVDEFIENPRRNKYFVRLAAEAARKWKFEPADNQISRKWLLRFEFTRRGAEAHLAKPKSGGA